jgi:hypothetical protein
MNTRDVTEQCVGACATGKGGRSVFWCGYGTNTPGDEPHKEHDWYSYRQGGWMHCYGTGEGK